MLVLKADKSSFRNALWRSLSNTLEYKNQVYLKQCVIITTPIGLLSPSFCWNAFCCHYSAGRVARFRLCFSARSDDLIQLYSLRNAMKKDTLFWRNTLKRLGKSHWFNLSVTAFESVIAAMIKVHTRHLWWNFISMCIFSEEAGWYFRPGPLHYVLPSVMSFFTRRTDLIRFEIVMSLHLIIPLIIEPADLLKALSPRVFKLTV